MKKKIMKKTSILLLLVLAVLVLGEVFSSTESVLADQKIEHLKLGKKKKRNKLLFIR